MSKHVNIHGEFDQACLYSIFMYSDHDDYD